MYEKFEALNEEKRMRILNSAFDEFSKKRFKEASTDEISKNAEVSKGSLFQYFGTKKKLYLYSYEYAYAVIQNDFWGAADLSNPDLLERIRGIFKIKMGLYLKYPKLFEFIMNTHTRETDGELKNLTNRETEEQKNELYALVYANVDYSRFKQDFKPEHILSIILWTLDGYAENEIGKLKKENLSTEKYDHWLGELDQYLETLKKAFYKE